eukprot:UN04987
MEAKFLEIERQKVKYIRESKKPALEEEETRRKDEQESKKRQEHEAKRAEGEKIKAVKEAIFRSCAQSLDDLLSKESSKEKPVLSTIKEIYNDLKSQLER